MIYCPSCSAKLLVGAKFCHHCGTCLHDEGDLVLEPQKPKVTSRDLIYLYTPKDKKKLKAEVKADFFMALRKRVEDEQKASLYADYVERFYKVRFQDVLEDRADILVDEMHQLQAKSKDAESDFTLLVSQVFENLMDYLMIVHCSDLNLYPYPQAILKYADEAQKLDKQILISDYLNLDVEVEKIYTDFITMPTQKLRNAADSFVQAGTDERLYFIIDQTLLGSCKEGVAMTDKALYWKLHFERPHRILYTDIHTVRREKEWILINNKYFNVNVGLNIKMMKLLRKMKEVKF